MKNQSIIYKIAMVLATFLPVTVNVTAQSIKVLDIAHGTSAANIKAEIVDAGDKTITNVVGRTFHMPTGNSTTGDGFRMIGDRYVVANLDYHEGADYFYRLEVTFDDGSQVKTDCYNNSYTEGAVWLSDLPITSKSSNDLVVGVDMCANGRPLQIHPNSTYAKGISLFYPAEVTFNVARQNEHNVPFTYSKFTIGLQAYLADGSNSDGYCRVIYKMNGAETGSKGNMRAYSNPARGNGVYYFDQTQQNTNGINSVGFKVANVNASTAVTEGNCGILGACRLYYPVPARNGEPQTITFDNPGGLIREESPEVQLGAYASGRTPIYFSIVQGSDLATLENGVLRPIYGKSGEIVVEAFTPGDDTYAPASATQTYTFNFGPTVKYLYTHTHVENPELQTLYLFIDSQDKTLEKLTLDLYDDARAFNHVKTVDLIANGLESYATGLKNIYAVAFNSASSATAVHQLKYKFSGEDETVGPLSEGDESFLYMSDIPGMVITAGYGVPCTDTAYSGLGRLRNEKYSYSKGYGIHAVSSIETPTSFSLAPFYRFKVDVGGQDCNNSSRGRLSFALYNGVTTPYLNTGNVDWQNVYEWDFMLQSTSSGKTVKIQIGNGGDGNTRDVTCIGAPRFYYIKQVGEPQTIEWQTEQQINNYRAFTVPLTAVTSSGLPVIYRIISGSEYAKIVDGNVLSITDLPEESADIVVEAFQPGNKVYDHTDVATCHFKLSRSLIVGRAERIGIAGGSDINELIVYGDSESVGQVVVDNGVVNVKRMVLKYTFKPGEWNHLSFPSNFNLADISDLSTKGFRYATEEGNSGTFLLREFNSQLRAENVNESPWISPATPDVVGAKGYIMKLESGDETPVEITFVMNNVALDFENTLRNIFLSVDLTNVEPESRQTVYLRPSNVKGNTLRVDIRFTPTDLSLLPVNHAKALEQMRVTHTPIRGAIRLTLPEQTPARVAIFDKKGKKMLKAFNYISPMKIDISDLKPDTYRMVVVYGNASKEMLVEL